MGTQYLTARNVVIHNLAKELLNDVQKALQPGEANENLAASKIKAIIEANLRRLNLVTREEFDAQVAVLERTRAKLEQLEQQLSAIEGSQQKQEPQQQQDQ